MTLIEKLEEFTDSQLCSELSRREEARLDASKEKTPRIFYRKVEMDFAKVKDKIKWLSTLSEEEQDTMLEEEGQLYLLSKETEEEVKARLSRTAEAYEDYDQGKCDYYENGTQVGSGVAEMLRGATHYKEAWENDKEVWTDYYYTHNGIPIGGHQVEVVHLQY